jgi:hypothetical protein
MGHLIREIDIREPGWSKKMSITIPKRSGPELGMCLDG